MAATIPRDPRSRDLRWVLHPLHAVFLASILPLALGAMLSDIAYARTYHVQWTNFAAWLVLGVNVFSGATLVFALAGLLGARRRDMPALLYAGLVLAVFVVSVFNSFQHAKDAWAAMPAAVVLSVITFLFALAAAWLGFAGYRRGDRT